MAKFDYLGAKQAGYSDDDIAKYLQQQQTMGQDVYVDKNDFQQAQPAPQPEKGIVEKSADTVNKAVGMAGKAMDYTGLPWVANEAGKMVGGLVGGVSGGILETGWQTMRALQGHGFNTGEITKTSKDIGAETGNFMGGMARGVVEGAPLMALGRIPLAVVAASQGYQGVKDIFQGLKEGDVEKSLQGGKETAFAILAALGSAKGAKGGGVKEAVVPGETGGVPPAGPDGGGGGLWVNPEVAAGLKSLAPELRVRAYEKYYKNSVDTYRDTLNMTKKEMNVESQNYKNTPELLTREGITLKSESGRLKTEEPVSILQERIKPKVEELNQKMAENPVEMDLNELRQKAIDKIKSEKGVAALEKEKMTKAVNDYTDAELRARFPDQVRTFLEQDPKANLADLPAPVDGPTMNEVKQGFWDVAYNPNEVVTNEAVWDMGHVAKDMIQEAYKGKVDIEGLNQQIGDYASAIRLLKKIDNRIVRGGMLGRLVYKGIGAVAGSSFGPVGSIAGAEIAGRASDLATSAGMRTGIRQRVLETLKSPARSLDVPPEATTPRTLEPTPGPKEPALPVRGGAEVLAGSRTLEPVTPEVRTLDKTVKTGYSNIVDEAYRSIMEKGGVTIDLAGNKPEQGYAFSPFKDAEYVKPKEAFTKDDMAEYVATQLSRLSKQGHHIGGWEDGGKVYLDIAKVGEPNATTIADAEKNGQLAVFDLANKETIYTKLSPEYAKQKADVSHLNGGENAGTNSGGSVGSVPEVRGGQAKNTDSAGTSAEKIKATVDGILKANKDKGEAIVIDADGLKKVANDFDPKNHEIYSAAAKELYARALKEVKNPLVEFTAGGSGSGKSELLVKGAVKNSDGIIYDGTFSEYDTAKEKINQATTAGKQVIISGILPDIKRAWRFVQKREATTGRPVPLNVFLDKHLGFIETFKRFVEQHPEVQVRLKDTRKVTNKAQALKTKFINDRKVILDKLNEIRYDRSVLESQLKRYGKSK